MKPLYSQRERCHACGEKPQLTLAEAEKLTALDHRLVLYFCPAAGHCYHVAREDDARLREGDLDYED